MASAGAQKTLLQEEFPSLTFVELPGYQVKYDKNRALTIWRLLRSIPKILIRIKHEKAWLSHFVGRERLDLVISDNRYGLTIPGVFCVFMTHQLLIKTPFGGWADDILQFLNYRMIRRFSRCWVPDNEAAGLAGVLSHPRRMPGVPTRYIGWLSRFAGTGGPGGSGGDDDARDRGNRLEGDRGDGYLVTLLSGPEPQRTLFEKELLRQAASLPLRDELVLVRGLPGGGTPLKDLPAGITCFDHLPAGELESLLLGAALVVVRAGYSSIMDLQRLGKRTLLVPTPGQTEQEYLGSYLAGKGWVSSVGQRAFSLSAAFELARAGGDPWGIQRLEEQDFLGEEIRKVLELAQS